jgi:lysozyme
MLRRLVIVVLLLSSGLLILFGLCFFGIWIPNEPSWKKYPVRGIDVSHHQRDINWNAVKGARLRFVYMKATEGSDFKDPRFSEYWENSKATGLRRGAYHFFILGASGQLQAANFIASVPNELDALPPAIDLEFSGLNKERRPSPADFQRELSAFWDAIVLRYGKAPVVYTASDFQSQYLSKMPLEYLWIRKVISSPRQPWKFWQFSSRGRVPGISTFVDLDVFDGTLADFEKFNSVKNQ